MIKRSLVLGGLVAGAFLLPNLANAGVVTGACVNCHTMHNSQNGTNMNGTATGNDQLLIAAGCVGCHASADENTATGKPVTGTLAPQVDNVIAGTAGFVLNGGYFEKTAGVSAQQHNVATLAAAADAVFGTNTTPGGGARTAQLICQDCHTQAGHHVAAANSYQMLTGANASNDAAQAGDYGATAKAATTTAGTRSEILYRSVDMNLFCAGCHGTFHTAANQNGSVVGSNWVRHPTDIAVTNSTLFPSIVTMLNTADTDAVVVGSAAAAPAAGDAGVVMCLSCHVPHGGPYNDLLSFDYTAELAGGTTVSTGCEKCHSYGGNGM